MKRIIAIVLISSIVACQSEQKKTGTDDTLSHQRDSLTLQTDSLPYQYDSVKIYSKNPVPVNKKVTDTAVATIVFPDFKNAQIDAIVQANVLNNTGPDEPVYKSYKELATGFIQRFDEFNKEENESAQTWFKEVNITVLPQRKDYLGLKYFFIDYAGGAHPNTAIIYKNYNAVTLKEIKLDELVPPANQPKLTAIAEQLFRKNEHLTPTQSLENNYFFDKGIFTLNDNFTISDLGLKFLYNSYEIKPYAAGTTELMIPYTAIKELLIANPALPVFK